MDLVIDGLDTYAVAKLVCDPTSLSSRAESAFFSFPLAEWPKNLRVNMAILFLFEILIERFEQVKQSVPISHRLSVKKNLRVGSNELLLHFGSTFLKVIIDVAATPYFFILSHE